MTRGMTRGLPKREILRYDEGTGFESIVYENEKAAGYVYGCRVD